VLPHQPIALLPCSLQKKAKLPSAPRQEDDDNNEDLALLLHASEMEDNTPPLAKKQREKEKKGKKAAKTTSEEEQVRNCRSTDELTTDRTLTRFTQKTRFFLLAYKLHSKFAYKSKTRFLRSRDFL
jgi:hypothetical protein